MKRKIFLPFILLFPLLSHILKAQFYLVKENNEGIVSLQFNPSFIRQHNIKKITAIPHSKAPNSRIEKKKEEITYTFNSSGNLVQETLFQDSDELKALVNRKSYTYDTLGQLKIQRIMEAEKYIAFYYEYDSTGMLIKKIQCKETNESNDANYFKLGKQDVIFLETFSYNKFSPRQQKKYCYNDIGKIYKEAIIYYDDKGNKTEENYRFSTTGIRINYQYKYNEANVITEQSYYSDANGNYTELSQYIYEDNKLSQQTLYRNQELQFTKFYFYNKENSFLESELTKYALEEYFDITEFSYER